MTISVESRARIAFGLLLVLGAAAGLLWYFLASSRYTTLEIRTRDLVPGLVADSPVEFHGVEVGSIERVQLIDAHTVSILLSVKRDAPVTRATVAIINSRGLAARGFTGYVYVDLENVGNDSRPLTLSPDSPYPLIRNVSSESASLDTAATDVRHDVEVLTGLVQSVLDRRSIASLKQSLDNLQAITRTLAANNRKLETMISNAERASARIERVSASAERASASAERAGSNAERASRQIEPLLESSQRTVGAMQTQVLPEAYDTLVKLHKLSNSLQELTGEIERNPSVLVRGKSEPPPGPGEKR